MKIKIYAYVLILNLSLGSPGIQAEKIHTVQALFLYNFANFAEWPFEAFSSSTDALKLCLYGEIEFENALRQFENARIGVRPLKIIKSINLDDVKSGCHMLFISQKQHERFPDFWSRVDTWFLLRVGEQEGFANNGGIINILQTRTGDVPLELEINLYNAMESGLLLSPDLLTLAREIKRYRD